MDDNSVKEIGRALLQITQLIEQDQFAAASDHIRILTAQHPEWVDERLQAELQLVMKQLEYKIALKDYAYLRSLALVYRYCEMNYSKTVLQSQPAQAPKGAIDVDQPMPQKRAMRTGQLELREEAMNSDQLVLQEMASGSSMSNQQDSSTVLPEWDTIWWCWLQGYERAPDLIKSCYRSLEKLGKKVVILDESNMEKYVKLPDHILEKYQRGIISRAHYSDLIRLELLTRRGGTWIDATTWISGTERILPLLESEDLFMFRAGHVSEYIIFDNWFIHAAKSSRILEATKELLYIYWQKEDEAKHYFIFHLMMTLACKHFQEEYEKVAVFSNEPCHVLQYELQKSFTERRWEQIKGMSDVHKLTYKINEIQDKGTFLQYVLSAD